MKKPDPKEIFKRLDKNEDNQLSLEEFAEGMKQLHEKMRQFGPKAGGRGPMMRPGHPPFGDMAKRMKERAEEMFEKADANKDGKVSLDEVPSERKEHFEKLLARADKDGDKALSKEEGKAAMCAMAERMREGRGKDGMRKDGAHRKGPGKKSDKDGTPKPPAAEK